MELRRYVGTSTSAITYDIGSDTVYTPVALTFCLSTGTGSVMANKLMVFIQIAVLLLLVLLNE